MKKNSEKKIVQCRSHFYTTNDFLVKCECKILVKCEVHYLKTNKWYFKLWKSQNYKLRHYFVDGLSNKVERDVSILRNVLFRMKHHKRKNVSLRVGSCVNSAGRWKLSKFLVVF